MHLLGQDQMPPLGRTITDPGGSAKIDDWITSWIDCATGPDSDNDGIGDASDNCVSVANPSQADGVGNGIGDACRSVCNDGIDNDGDGSTDYPEDRGCASAHGTNEMPQCQDGIDNDGDGLIDSPFDRGCEGPHDACEFSACEDGIDNDADGSADWDGAGTGSPDPECEGRPFNHETAAVPAPPDADADGVLDTLDNCLGISNPDQHDSNGDGYGNLCDPDVTNDGVISTPDFLVFSEKWGLSLGEPGYAPDVDLTGDNKIGVPDFLKLSAYWGKEPGPSGLHCAEESGSCAALCGP